MKPKTTPKDFFMWAGAMVALYWAVITFIFLIFNYIDYAFPNALAYMAQNPYDSGVGFEMASLVVLFPIYAMLAWLIRRDQAADPSRKEVWVRRWALILTLFVAGVTIAGDLITLLSAFFSGSELTTGFLLKVAVLLLVAAGVFMHFIADFWDYWEEFPSRRRSVCYGAGVLAALAVIAGFVMFGSPMQARQYRLDTQRVNDLQNIQWQVVNYWQQNQKLPADLSSLNDAISNYTVPTDPSTGAPYEYRVTGVHAFELCAAFGAASVGSALVTTPEPMSVSNGTTDNWTHGVGRTCFERAIDPARYPPLNKNVPRVN